jgi:hypothetical protein
MTPAATTAWGTPNKEGVIAILLWSVCLDDSGINRLWPNVSVSEVWADVLAGFSGNSENYFPGVKRVRAKVNG